jgi:hypothetical protein
MKGKEDVDMAESEDDMWTSTTTCHAMLAINKIDNLQTNKKSLESKICFGHNMSVST